MLSMKNGLKTKTRVTLNLPIVWLYQLKLESVQRSTSALKGQTNSRKKIWNIIRRTIYFLFPSVDKTCWSWRLKSTKFDERTKLVEHAKGLNPNKTSHNDLPHCLIVPSKTWQFPTGNSCKKWTKNYQSKNWNTKRAIYFPFSSVDRACWSCRLKINKLWRTNYICGTCDVHESLRSVSNWFTQRFDCTK